MDDKTIKKLIEYGINENLERPSFKEFTEKKVTEWLENGQTLFGENSEGIPIIVYLNDKGERVTEEKS